MNISYSEEFISLTIKQSYRWHISITLISETIYESKRVEIFESYFKKYE